MHTGRPQHTRRRNRGVLAPRQTLRHWPGHHQGGGALPRLDALLVAAKRAGGPGAPGAFGQGRQCRVALGRRCPCEAVLPFLGTLIAAQVLVSARAPLVPGSHLRGLLGRTHHHQARRRGDGVQRALSIMARHTLQDPVVAGREPWLCQLSAHPALARIQIRPPAELAALRAIGGEEAPPGATAREPGQGGQLPQDRGPAQTRGPGARPRDQAQAAPGRPAPEAL